MSQPSILVFSLWFGPWPGWMRCFLASCRWNPTIDWLIIGDAEAPEDAPENVRFKRISFDDYGAICSTRLGVKVRWRDAYKVCDVRPALACIHESEVAPYDFWGYCDLDVVFGDIRGVYSADYFDHDVISTHEDRVCGHFALFRNNERMANAFRLIPFWRALLSSPKHKSFDETIFSRLFVPVGPSRGWRRLFTPFLGGGRFFEQFSTALPPLRWIDGSLDWPEEWYWERGHLTTSRSGDREFLYLHFSHWQSDRWMRGGVAAWKKLDKIVDLPPSRPERFVISARGFTSGSLLGGNATPSDRRC